jgi:hypothetical protein
MLNYNNYNSKWKKILGFRNMQEKLEKVIFIRVFCRKEPSNNLALLMLNMVGCSGSASVFTRKARME